MLNLFHAEALKWLLIEASNILFYSLVCPISIDAQEQNSLPSLRKALKDVSIEKDAAIVAKVTIFRS